MLDIRNYYEQLVTEQIWQLKNQQSDQNSQIFWEDVACLALNSLEPCYVRNLVDKSSNMTELEYQQMHNKVAAAIKTAMEQANQRSHDGRDG